jgi:two-component system, OmpR family, sensor histidine kinase BaeS
MTHAATSLPDPDPHPHPAHAEIEPHADSLALAPWGFALSLATLGTAILFDASVGINWGIWIICVAVPLFAMMRERFGSVGSPSFVACTWAVILAFGTAVTSNGFSIGLLIFGTIVLMAIALVTAGQSSTDVLQLGAALYAPFRALSLVLSGAISEGASTARNARSPRTISLVRSTLITVPLVTGLVFLLAEADPLFASARDGLEHIIPHDIIPKAIFFTAALAATLGAFGAVLHGDVGTPEETRVHVGIVGAPESRVLLSAIASIMWIFVVSAGAGLLKNPAAIAGSGITYAEYVHRGFAELSVSATLVIGVVLATRSSWLASDAWARRLAFAAIAGESGMIAIAFMRVVRYEQVYGFTAPRLYAQAYMIVLACMSVLAIAEIVRGKQSRRFAFHSANAALAIFASCIFGNTDAWIVRHNVDRYQSTGKIDIDYLTRQLSEDATPELIASLPRLKVMEHAAVTGWLCDVNSRKRPRDQRWFTWNYRAARELSARREWYRDTRSNCTPPS